MYCCIPTPTTDSKTGTGMIWVTLNMLSATEERHEPSGNCQGISHCLESGHPALKMSPTCCSVMLLNLVYVLSCLYFISKKIITIQRNLSGAMDIGWIVKNNNVKVDTVILAVMLEL